MTYSTQTKIPLSRMETDQSYNIGVYALSFLAVMGISLTAPILPDIAKAFHVSETSVGWVIIAFTIPCIAVSLVCGVLSDLLGRKPVVLVGITIFSLGGVLCAVATSFEALLFFRAFQGIGGGVTGVMYTMLVADRYTGIELTKQMGTTTAVLSLGMAVLPLLGGWLGEISWRWPFIATAAGGFVAFMYIFIPLRKPAGDFNLRAYVGSMRSTLTDKNILVIFVLTFFGYSIFYGPINTYFPLMANARFHATSAHIGLVFSLGALGSAAISASLVYLARHISLRHLMLAAAVGYALAQVLMMRTTSLWSCIMPLCICALARGLYVPILYKTLVADSKPKEHASLIALNSAVFRLSQSVAPLAYGLAWTAQGWTGPYWLGLAVACSIGLIIMVFFGKEGAHSKPGTDMQGVHHNLHY